AGAGPLPLRGRGARRRRGEPRHRPVRRCAHPAPSVAPRPGGRPMSAGPALQSAPPSSAVDGSSDSAARSESAPWLPALCAGLAPYSVSAIFADWTWFAPTLVMIVLVVGSGAALRAIPVIRATGSAVLGQCVLAVLAALYLCVPSAMPFGVPSPGAFAELFAV